MNCKGVLNKLKLPSFEHSVSRTVLEQNKWQQRAQSLELEYTSINKLLIEICLYHNILVLDADSDTRNWFLIQSILLNFVVIQEAFPVF